MSRAYSILLAESSPLLREKIAGVLARDERIWGVTQVEGREGLILGAARVQPDFILAELSILNDLETLKSLRRSSAGSLILALVDSNSEYYESAAQRLGLDGIIEKGCVENALDEMRLLRETREEADDKVY